jgi:hypothetical protein
MVEKSLFKMIHSRIMEYFRRCGQANRPADFDPRNSTFGLEMPKIG